MDTGSARSAGRQRGAEAEAADLADGQPRLRLPAPADLRSRRRERRLGTDVRYPLISGTGPRRLRIDRAATLRGSRFGGAAHRAVEPLAQRDVCRLDQRGSPDGVALDRRHSSNERRGQVRGRNRARRQGGAAIRPIGAAGLGEACRLGGTWLDRRTVDAGAFAAEGARHPLGEAVQRTRPIVGPGCRARTGGHGHSSRNHRDRSPGDQAGRPRGRLIVAKRLDRHLHHHARRLLVGKLRGRSGQRHRTDRRAERRQRRPGTSCRAQCRTVRRTRSRGDRRSPARRQGDRRVRRRVSGRPAQGPRHPPRHWLSPPGSGVR